MNRHVPIVLASKSPRRSQLLRELGLDFEIVPSRIEEIRAPGEAPVAFAKRVALEKGREVCERLERENQRPWIVSADTIVVLGDAVFFKPADPDEAKAMMIALQGKTHQVVTGWAVGRFDRAFRVEHTETDVTFHPLSSEEIDRYVATGEGLDKAGAYAIQGIGAYLVSKIKGNYFNVVGLPVSYVARALVEAGALAHYPLS
jgi:septum formation protein